MANPLVAILMGSANDEPLLEPTKKAVLDMKASLDRAGIANQDAALRQASGQAFYNASPFTLRDLRARASQQHRQSIGVVRQQVRVAGWFGKTLRAFGEVERLCVGAPHHVHLGDVAKRSGAPPGRISGGVGVQGAVEDRVLPQSALLLRLRRLRGHGQGADRGRRRQPAPHPAAL